MNEALESEKALAAAHTEIHAVFAKQLHLDTGEASDPRFHMLVSVIMKPVWAVLEGISRARSPEEIKTHVVRIATGLIENVTRADILQILSQIDARTINFVMLGLTEALRSKVDRIAHEKAEKMRPEEQK